MTEGKRYDLIVIGAGAGGLNIAGFAARVGLSTLLIDRSAEAIGGDCLNFGCVPSKALIHAARQVRAARESARFGLQAVGAADMAKVGAYIKEAQALFRAHENPEYLRGLGIDVALGEASFAGPDSVRVGNAAYRARRIVIATGSRPRPYALSGAEGLAIHSNETIFGMGSLPKKFVLVGGGPISLEIGQAFSRLGSQVAIIHSGAEILPKEDADVARRLRRRLEAEGIAFYLDASAQSVEKGRHLRVRGARGEASVEFDALFAAVGRIPNTDSLRLEAAGIAVRDGRLVVDEYLRTSNPRVVAIGDAAGSYQFTHAAELHAALVLRNLFSPFKKKISYDSISWVTYTDPELATFGRSARELEKAGIRHDVLARPFGDDDRAMIDGYRDSYVKLYLDPRGRILGGTMLAPNAGELVQELSLAMREGVPLPHLAEKVYPYPSAGRINRSLALEYARRRLTPRAAAVLRFLSRL